jgi:hypothetical protein
LALLSLVVLLLFPWIVSLGCLSSIKASSTSIFVSSPAVLGGSP